MRLAVVVSCLLAAALGCSEVLEGSSGTFTSPNYPNDYSTNLECTWTISVPSGRIRIDFTDFELEDTSVSCNYDRVVVKDGSSTGAVLGTYCGTSAAAVVGSGSTVVVQLITDSSIQRKGFSASWSVSGEGPRPTDSPGTPTQAPPTPGCGDNLEGETGTFASQNHPNNYPDNSDCTWNIAIPDGTVVLKFDAFDVESNAGCTYDSLKVYDGASNELLATLCGTSAGPVEGKSNSMRLVFTSDSSVSKTGFSGSWERLTCASKGLTCVADQASCAGNVMGGLYCENNGVCCEPPFDQGECGIIAPSPALIGGAPRIVGGNEAARHSWPWQVSLRTTSSNFHFCGGSIISASWVVTAAHCVDGDTPSGLKVTSGEHHKDTTSGREQDHTVSKIIMHEAYDGNGAGFPNDIALLKLASPMSLDNYRRPICLAEADETFFGAYDCFITGWGNTQGTGDANVLNELDVDVWDQSVCSNTWGSSYINSGHICVGTGDTGACNGDSGGPLACLKSRDGVNRWILAGATSWGRSGCQTAGYPSVYSRVSFFREWLLRTIREN